MAYPFTPSKNVNVENCYKLTVLYVFDVAPQREQFLPKPPSLRNPSKFRSSETYYCGEGSKIVQNTITIYVKPTKDFRLKSILQDEQLESKLKTTYFCE